MDKIKNVLEVEGIKTDTYAGKTILALRIKLSGILGDSGFLFIHLMDIVNYIMLHDIFASKGFFITKENQEEMYIKIIETCDESLINNLEKYILVLDKLSYINEVVQEYNDLVNQIKEVSDFNNEEEINAIIKDFINR